MPSMQSNYTLNIARNTGKQNMYGGPRYEHFCTVELGPDGDAAKARAADIVARFPASEFCCDLTYWQCHGTSVPLAVTPAAIPAIPAALRQAREALDSTRGNINPERGFASELEEEVTRAIAAIDAATR